MPSEGGAEQQLSSSSATLLVGDQGGEGGRQRSCVRSHKVQVNVLQNEFELGKQRHSVLAVEIDVKIEGFGRRSYQMISKDG